MVSRLVVRLLMVGCLLALMCVSVSAGGPCRPPACGPVCAPPPPMCGPATLRADPGSYDGVSSASADVRTAALPATRVQG